MEKKLYWFAVVGFVLSLLVAAGCSSSECVAGMACACEGGTCADTCGGDGRGCSFQCSDGASCNNSCPGGSCGMTCSNADSCILDCPGGGCSLNCVGTDTCEIRGCTAGCGLACSGASTCSSSCGPVEGCAVSP